MTTGPGITERCTPDQPCPKSLDPAGVSWADGCWCYRNPNEPATVWVQGMTGTMMLRVPGLAEALDRGRDG